MHKRGSTAIQGLLNKTRRAQSQVELLSLQPYSAQHSPIGNTVAKVIQHFLFGGSQSPLSKRVYWSVKAPFLAHFTMNLVLLRCSTLPHWPTQPNQRLFFCDCLQHSGGKSGQGEIMIKL